MTNMLDVMIDLQSAVQRLERAEKLLANPAPIMRAIAGTLESETKSNFEKQGRPSWAPLSKATLAKRVKKNKGSSVLQILQDSGLLSSSISTSHGPDFALIGASRDYAAIHQFGGEITVPARTTKVRLKTTPVRGVLSRRRANPNLAVFAKRDEVHARESWHEVGEYKIKIPARPYLPFRGPPGGAVIQPEAEQSMLAVLEKMLGGAFK